MSEQTISPQAFAALVEALGLKVNGDELDELRQAYGALRLMKDRVRAGAWDTEPAHVFTSIEDAAADWPPPGFEHIPLPGADKA